MTEPVTPPAAPALGTPEYDAAMIAAADKRAADAAALASGTPPPPAKAEKPEGVPDKFWNAEKGEVNYADWSKSTAELEKKLSQGKPPETPPAGTPPDAAAEALKGKGLNVSEFNTEFAEKGELSPDSYAKLETAGFDKTTVDSYIAGQKALAEQYDATAYEVVGGAENYAKEVTWAKSNMTPAESAAFNEAVTSGDRAKLKLAVAGLHQAYTKANGSEPALLNGSASAPPQGGFRSRAEQSAAINKTDERGRQLYRIDPAYRADVEKRIATATFT